MRDFSVLYVVTLKKLLNNNSSDLRVISDARTLMRRYCYGSERSWSVDIHVSMNLMIGEIDNNHMCPNMS